MEHGSRQCHVLNTMIRIKRMRMRSAIMTVEPKIQHANQNIVRHGPSARHVCSRKTTHHSPSHPWRPCPVSAVHS